MFVTVYRRDRAKEKALAEQKAKEATYKKRGRPSRRKKEDKKWFALIVTIPTQMAIKVTAVIAENLLKSQLLQKSHSHLQRSQKGKRQKNPLRNNGEN